MRRVLGCLAACLAGIGCGSGGGGRLADASVVDGDVYCPRLLLAGGSDVVAQGWTPIMLGPATLSYGADFVRLVTSTTAGAQTGGQLLLAYPGAVEAGSAFKLEVVMLVESTSPHNQLDSAAAILGSFTPPFGASIERDEMLYLDRAAVGWADDTQSVAIPVVDGTYHTYQLAVDAAGAAKLTVDGAAALTRNGYTTTGRIAIGDQTNEPNLDSALQIRSVTRLCP